MGMIARALFLWRALHASAETHVPVPLLSAVAQHESDRRPDIVSYRENGKTVSRTYATVRAWPRRAVCGYLQAMASTRDACARMIAEDGGMLAGAREIAEWMRMCRGELACALSGHAGGWAGVRAWRERRATDATAFAYSMLRRARKLGMR